MKTIANSKAKLLSNKKISDFVFILWTGGAVLLSYSLALRKPFTAASFDGMEAFGLDYKVLTTIIQILGRANTSARKCSAVPDLPTIAAREVMCNAPGYCWEMNMLTMRLWHAPLVPWDVRWNFADGWAQRMREAPS